MVTDGTIYIVLRTDVLTTLPIITLDEIMTSVFDTHPPLIHVLISYVKEIMF